MTPDAADPASAGARTGSGGVRFGGEQIPGSPAFPKNQGQNSRNPRAVREATIASILDESHWLLGSLTVQASIAQQFAELGDARGFLYSLDRVVEQAIRAGAGGVELRRIRKEMRETRR